MKKIILIASVAIVGLGFSSCKKDWTCDCKFSNAPNGIPSYNGNLNNAKKKDAKAACDQIESTWSVFGASCELK